MPAPSLSLPFAAPATTLREAAGLASSCGVSPLAAAILRARGFTSSSEAAAFIAPTNALSGNPFAMKGMKAVAERVTKAVAAKQPITIYGDYDADGIPGTALLVNFLRNAGAKVTSYIPPRESGYGLSMAQAKIVRERFAPALVITVDCGSSDHEAVAWLRKQGVDVVVTDHHLTLKGVPPTPYFINPSRADGETYPFRYLCGCGVAYKLVQALSTRPHEPALYDLVALSTVGDLVSLTGENRFYVTAALKQLHARASGNVGLRALVETAGGTVSMANLNAVDFGWKIAPRINAVGRMGADPNMVVELLTTSDHARAMSIAKETHRLNSSRQTLTDRLFEEALESVGAKPAGQAIVAYLPEAGVGVAGLVAAKLVEMYNRPVLVVNAEGRGSGRSPDGVPLIPILEQLKSAGIFGGSRRLATGETVTADFGGHAQAAGFHHVDVAALRKAIGRVTVNKGAVPAVPVDVEATIADLTPGALRDVDAVGPFGIGNQEPAVLFRGLSVARQVPSSTGRSLLLTLSDGRIEIPAVQFNGGENAGKLPAKVDVIGLPASFGGAPQLRIRAIRPAK